MSAPVCAWLGPLPVRGPTTPAAAREHRDAWWTQDQIGTLPPVLDFEGGVLARDARIAIQLAHRMMAVVVSSTSGGWRCTLPTRLFLSPPALS